MYFLALRPKKRERWDRERERWLYNERKRITSPQSIAQLAKQDQAWKDGTSDDGTNAPFEVEGTSNVGAIVVLLRTAPRNILFHKKTQPWQWLHNAVHRANLGVPAAHWFVCYRISECGEPASKKVPGSCWVGDAWAEEEVFHCGERRYLKMWFQQRKV